jgi:ribose transport system substrate-binding protein
MNLLRSRITFSGVLLAVAVLFSQCGGSSSQNAGDEKKALQIAVVPKGSTHTHWKSVRAGAEQAGKELGVEIIWQGPQKEDDRQMQIQVVQNFVSRGVNGILMAPLDDRALVPPVKAAISRKIPVVIFDSRLTGNDFSAYVATDNYAGGKLCAKQLAEELGGKGKVILLRYNEGSASTQEREKGFLDGMKEYAPQVVFLSENQYAGATIEKAFQSSQNLLNQFGGEVQGIFASNESATQGMLRALEQKGLAGKVKFVGFDVNQTLLNAIKDGKLQGAAIQDPVKMGYEGVKTLVAVIKGEKYEKEVDTGVKMVTKANLSEPDIQKLLEPHMK